MGKIKEKKVSNLWSGIVNDPKSTIGSGFYYSENLDVGSKKTVKQIVNNQDENACGYDVDDYITKVIKVGDDIYGLGQDDNVNNDTSVWTKTADLTGTWSIVTNGTIVGSTYRGGDALLSCINGVMFLDGTASVAKYVIETDTMTDDWKPLVGGMKGGEIWQGRIYGWDIDNYIYEIDPTADTLTQKILIPLEQTPVQIVPYGSLLMIICTSTVTNSKAYLWDGVNTSTFTEILNIGHGTVAGGGMLDGIAYAIIGSDNKKKLKIKKYIGGIDFVNEYTYSARPDRDGTYRYIQPASKVKVFSGFLYFVITGTKPDGTYANYYEYSIARYGREEPITPMTFSIYKTLDFTSARGIDGQTANNEFTIMENIVGTAEQDETSILAFINSDTNKTTEFISSINDFSAQAGVLETYKYNEGDGAKRKKIHGISAFYSALSATGQVVMKYRKDEETDWTTIFTETTENSLSHQSVCIDGTWAILPTYKEIQLRLELIGGAELIGYKYKFEEIPAKNYA